MADREDGGKGSGMERRRAKRVDSVNLVTVDFPDADKQPPTSHLGRTLNLSPGGAAIEISSSGPLSVAKGTELLLTIVLGEQTILAHGEVVYERQVDERQVVVGVMFTGMLPDDLQVLLGFLRG